MLSLLENNSYFKSRLKAISGQRSFLIPNNFFKRIIIFGFVYVILWDTI